ncbi:MAG TPA: glycoside hydrolase family 15 protein [Actinomycetota bacterium]|nr:glycoside hydrolase family 15 protein [Actinomycetota bacterium]
MTGRPARVEPRYPAIGDYGFLSDCYGAALVSRGGSVDWCCLPRLDAGSVFGRLLDWDRGGYCTLAPAGAGWSRSRRYLDGTLVLETTFETEGGAVRLLDTLLVAADDAREPPHHLLRMAEGLRGTVEMRLRVAARLDYGEIAPWLRRFGPDWFAATGGNDALLVWSDSPLDTAEGHDLTAAFPVHEGQRRRLSIRHTAPEALEPTPPAPPTADELDRQLDQTIAWWRGWSDRIQTGAAVRRSAITLRGLINIRTGAAAAAATTSLPESPGGSRNWDYRYAWIRDAGFTVRALASIGMAGEADGFRRFVERTAAGTASNLQIVYGVGGERHLPERRLEHLEGYRRSAPVRVGNAAADQLQLDSYGELLDLAWRWHQRGHRPDDDYWRFLVSLVDAAAERWTEPDRGIWELRGRPRHLVHSKVLCWAALDRGIRLASDTGRDVPGQWVSTRDRIAREVGERGYDTAQGTFVQAFGSSELDAALLLLPVVGFVDFQDTRMLGTVETIRTGLDDGNGLIRRYTADDARDEPEGAFIACNFWLAECLARQGRTREARATFERAAGCANDLGLFSEEADGATGTLLGNFPQGLSHLAHITAWCALDATGRPPQRNHSAQAS